MILRRVKLDGPENAHAPDVYRIGPMAHRKGVDVSADWHHL
jgi:hypothetical protein